MCKPPGAPRSLSRLLVEKGPGRDPERGRRAERPNALRSGAALCPQGARELVGGPAPRGRLSAGSLGREGRCGLGPGPSQAPLETGPSGVRCSPLGPHRGVGRTVTNQTVSQMGQEAGGPGKSASHFCIAHKYHADPHHQRRTAGRNRKSRVCACVCVLSRCVRVYVCV